MPERGRRISDQYGSEEPGPDQLLEVHATAPRCIWALSSTRSSRRQLLRIIEPQSNAEGAAQAVKRLPCWIALASFNPADLALLDSGRLGQLDLCQPKALTCSR